MGYYVTTTPEQEFFLAKEHYDEAYRLMCALNDRDDLKSGGSWGGDGVSADSERPAGLDYHPARWFAWMDSNYPAKCKNVIEILQELGFIVEHDELGIHHLAYDNKMGSEEYFLAVISHLVKDGSYIVWRGEEGNEWRWLFADNKMSEQSVAQKIWL